MGVMVGSATIKSLWSRKHSGDYPEYVVSVRLARGTPAIMIIARSNGGQSRSAVPWGHSSVRAETPQSTPKRELSRFLQIETDCHPQAVQENIRMTTTKSAACVVANMPHSRIDNCIQEK